ncbi:MAG: DUF975 family protein, partial [Bacteroidales bacterium]|nr:DUF975 family protein [Bacteroidales bacterium]
RLLDSRDNNILSNLTGYATTNYTKKVLTLLLKSIYVFLWSLLLVIPGIIKAFSYALVPYIISENPNLSPEEAISQSSKMMEGHRLDLFILYLSFIGWFILAVLTAGIGFLWLCPYISAAKASFYLDIKNEYNLAHPQVIISE